MQAIQVSSGALATELRQRFSIVVKTGTYRRSASGAPNSIRVAPHLYSAEADIDRLLAALPPAFAALRAAANEV